MSARYAVTTARQLIVLLEDAARFIGTSSPELARLDRMLEGADDLRPGSWDSIIDAFDFLARRHPTPLEFGLWLAERNKDRFDTFIASLFARTAATLGEALTRVVGFSRAVDGDSLLTLVSSESTSELQLARGNQGRSLSGPTGDFALASLLQFMRLARVPPLDMHFSFPYPRPAQIGAWQRSFGRRLSFRAQAHSVRFPAASLGVPMTTADSHLSAFLLGSESAPRSFAFGTRVTAAIDAVLGTRSQLLLAVAEQLGVSPRTVQRRLRDENLEFGELLDHTRHRRALRLLSAPGAKVADAAKATGYTDARAFRAAFERWAGCTPRVYRQRLRARPSRG